MRNRLILAVSCLMMVFVVGCKTGPKADAKSSATPSAPAQTSPSPFAGKWWVEDLEPEGVAREVGAVVVIIDEDGFVLVNATTKDGKEQAAVTGRWTQATAKRIDATFTIDDKIYKAYAWLTGPHTLKAVAMLDDDDVESMSMDLKRTAE